MDNAVYSSIDLSVKVETLNFEQRCQYKLKSVWHKWNPSILANKINHEQKQDVQLVFNLVWALPLDTGQKILGIFIKCKYRK